MKSSGSQMLLAISSLLFATSPAKAQQATPSLVLNAMTPEGCFSSSSPMQDQGSYEYQSSGYCQKICVTLGKAVMGTTMGSNCWCGDELPPADSQVSDSECNTPCYGYNKANCGGANTWSVSLTGTNNGVGNVQNSDSGSTSTASSSSNTPQTTSISSISTKVSVVASVVTTTGTVVVTAPSQPTASPSPTKNTNPGGPSKAGIAAGVVVGVVAIFAIAGGAFLLLRRRKRRALENEFQRNVSRNNFVDGGKPTSSSSTSDSRLEPSVMMQRRQSDGSIADNQDYSRRILKVTNPDGN
ncbi:hypothetical protein MMC12_000754 [Toensbergia leucococca]|nr:hypothetical protein [Toensbergia leucococca]